MLVDLLYRTNRNIIDACIELDVEFKEEMLEDLETCNSCGIWYHSYQLIPDDDDNNICKFCETHYGL